MSSVKFAISYTVKDEARLLPSAIEYHLAAGCSRIYVFWDGTSDDSKSLIAAFPSVLARDSITPSEVQNAPAWIIKILPFWEIDMDVRKRINTYYAAEAAALEGIDWLASLDPDELVLMALNEPITRDHVAAHLCRVPTDIDQVLLPCMESIPTSSESRNPFEDCVYFLNRFPLTEFIWRYSRAFLIRISIPPKPIAWYDYLFYQLRFGGALPRLMCEPGTLRKIPAGYFLGYSTYKSFIRLKTFSNFNFTTHRWLRYLRAPRSLRLGNVLHFDMLDANYFSLKHRQRQLHTQELFYTRNRLSLVARNSSDSEIREFFEKYIAIRDPNVLSRLKKKGILLEIREASDLLKGIASGRAEFVARTEAATNSNRGSIGRRASF